MVDKTAYRAPDLHEVGLNSCPGAFPPREHAGERDGRKRSLPEFEGAPAGRSLAPYETRSLTRPRSRVRHTGTSTNGKSQGRALHDGSTPSDPTSGTLKCTARQAACKPLPQHTRAVRQRGTNHQT